VNAMRKSVLMIGDVGASGGWYVSPHGYNLYHAGAGDSFESLARNYLLSADRWAEIYNLQSLSWRAARKNDPHVLNIGDELFMPPEAVARAKAMGLAAGGLGAYPGAVETPVGVPSAGIPAVPVPASSGTGTYTVPETTIYADEGTPAASSHVGLLIGGALAVVAGVLYAKHKPAIHREVRVAHGVAMHHARRIFRGERRVASNPRRAWLEV
jgi:hypothetical protein